LIALDANVLLYCYDSLSPHHLVCRTWLTEQLNTKKVVGIPWVSAWAFLRISTNPRISMHPLSMAAAWEILDELLSLRQVKVLNPGPRHGAILSEILAASGLHGRETTDAVLAAIAIEHGATLVSVDTGFSRFRTLRWLNPVDPAGDNAEQRSF